MSKVPQTRTAPVTTTTTSGSSGMCTGIFSRLRVRARVPNISTVVMPAPTAASVKATSTASSTTKMQAVSRL